MPFVITAPCVDSKDQSCTEVCPVECIHADPEDRNLYIDPNECIDCGACEPVCPTEAIYEMGSVPEEHKAWIEINALWYEDKDAARAKVNAIEPPPPSGG